MLTIDNPKKFDWHNISLADCIEGNCNDTYFTLKLYELFKEQLEGDPRWDLIVNLINPACDTFLDMEYQGVNISRANLKKVGKLVIDDNIDKEDDIYSMREVDRELNLNSSQDQAKILFLTEENRKNLSLILEGKQAVIEPQDGFGLYPPEFTDVGVPTCKKEALETILSMIEDELNIREDA